MAESLHEKLAKAYTPFHNLAQRDNLSLKEMRTIYRLRFGSRRDCVSYQIDGKIITAGAKCDFLILAMDRPEVWSSIFVELKGTDVEWALRQLDETMKKDLFSHPSVHTRYARIVAQSFPSNKANPAYEKAKREFMRRHNCNLRQIHSGQPDNIN